MLFNKFLVRFLFAVFLSAFSFLAFGEPGAGELLGRWRNAMATKVYRSDTASVILLNRLSEFYVYNNADSALYFAKQALELARFQKYTIGQARAINNISKTYYVIGDYTSSLTTGEQLMQLSNKIGYRPGVAGALQIIGLIYMAQNNYSQAITTLNKSLNMFMLLKDSARADKAYFNIGLLYDESGHPDKTFYYMDKAQEMASQVRDYVLISMIHNRRGEAYFHLKKYDQALIYYQKAIGSTNASTWEMDFAFSGLAQTYYATGDYQMAIIYAKKSLDLSRQVKSVSDAVRALEILSEAYAAANDYKQAYNYQVQFKKSNDSIFSSEKDKEINFLHLKQQQAYNAQLEGNIKSKEEAITYSRRLLFFRNIIAVCFVIFLILIIRSNRQKTKLNKVLQKQNTSIASQKEEISNQKEALDQLNHTKDQLFSVISHDLRSPFAAILQSMDFIRSGELSHREQELILASFHQQVSLVTIMVNNLLIWANSQQEGIKCNAVTLRVGDVVSEIISVSNFLAKNKNISIEHIYGGDKFVEADLDQVRIIVQNLISNAIKFTPNGGTIKVYYTSNEGYYGIHVKDDGLGIPGEKMDKLFKITGREISGYGTNNEAGAGIGLALIKQFVDANGGILEVRSKPGEGSEFIVYLRKVAMETPLETRKPVAINS